MQELSPKVTDGSTRTPLADVDPNVYASAQPRGRPAKRRRLIPPSVQANPVPIEAVDLTLPPPRGTDQPTEVQIEPVRAFPPPVRITN